MIRLFVDEDLTGRERFTLTGDTAHYLATVMRCGPGDEFIAVDALSRIHTARVEACATGQVEAVIIATAQPAEEAAFELALYPAMLKGKRFELVIQKCVELGCARIVPVITQRTISRPDGGKLGARTARWRKIAEEAARQCGRARIPEIAEPLDWADALQDWKASGAAGIIPYEALAGDRETGLRVALVGLKQTARLGAFIGPEGGYSPTEMQQALEAGLMPVSLGPRILRAETAAIVLCAIVMYEMESQ